MPEPDRHADIPTACREPLARYAAQVQAQMQRNHEVFVECNRKLAAGRRWWAERLRDRGDAA